MGFTSAAAPATTGVRLALFTMVFFFGGSLPAYKLAGESFGPATANLGRFVIAAIVMAIVARRHFASARGRWRRLFAVGVVGLGLMAVLIGIGVDEGSATIASIIAGLEPIGVAIAGLLLVGDRPNRDRVLALVLGFTGAVIASGVFTQTTGPSPVVPMIVLFGMVVTFSLYTAFVRRYGQGVHPLAVSAITQIGALAFVVPACLLDLANGGMLRGEGVTAKAWLGVGYLGVGSAVAYLLLVVVLADQPANRVAVALYLTPLIGVLLSWLVADEDLHLRHAIGAAVVLVAIWISERGLDSLRRSSRRSVASSVPIGGDGSLR